MMRFPFAPLPQIRFQPKALLVAVTLAFPLALGACSGDSEEEAYVERPVDELYNTAVDLLNDGQYQNAADAFDEVERQHPYSVWATKAQLMAAYSLYEDNEYDDAVIALNRYIELHPGNQDIAYAYYLRALCFYEQIADVGRDQEMTREAMDYLREVTTRFPRSDYARDASLKMDLAQDHLAGKEMSVGRFYLNQGHYLAALNRFRTVVDRFDQTTHVPEALFRIVEVNTVLGLPGEAERTAAVLGHNFPGSDWYVDAFGLVTGDRSYSAETDPDDGWFDWLL